LTKVFISYSHVDESFRAGLEKHLSVLKRTGEVDVWTDHCIAAGEDFDESIGTALISADLVLVLISPDFIASDYCYGVELNGALDRHKAGLSTVVPIILRPCDWKNTPVTSIKALPTDGNPIAAWSSEDQAFLDVVRGLRKILDNSRNVKISSDSQVSELKSSRSRNESDVNLSKMECSYVVLEVEGCIDPIVANIKSGWELLCKFKKKTLHAAKEFEANGSNWNASMGYLHFSGPHAVERSANAGLQLQSDFRAVLFESSAPSTVVFRISCFAPIADKYPSQIEPGIDEEFAKLQMRYRGRANSLLLSSKIHAVLDPEKADRFTNIGPFLGQDIYLSRSMDIKTKLTIHSSSRYAFSLSQEEEGSSLEILTAKIVQSGWHPSHIVAVLDPESPGGVIVGSKLVSSMSRYVSPAPKLETIHVADRGGTRVATNLPLLENQDGRVLIVDDAFFSGRTLLAAKHALSKAYPAASFRFAALVGCSSNNFSTEEKKSDLYLSRTTDATRANFTWDRVDSTESLRNALAVEYPDNLSFSTDFIVRPWGHMELFAVRKKAFVRILTIMPGHRLSRQKHSGRDEYFVALDAGLSIEVDDSPPLLTSRGDYVMIPRGTFHRFSNTSTEPLRCLEVAFGEIYNEEDIIRIEDDYGRSEPS
jgi:mannose-6-phosphate isomerase-like protein (cupin superfamily)/hypoxanthine-guanine phosphoribosyltransferase